MVYEITSHPITLRKDKIIYNFDLSECNRLFKIGHSKGGQEKG